MMKIFITSVLCLLLTVFVAAQISIDASTLPVAGDTLIATNSLTVNTIDNSSSGADQVWDFTSLTPGNELETRYQNASAGMNAGAFPMADLFADIAGTGEAYFNVDGSGISSLGFAGGDPSGFGLAVVAQFTEPYLQRRAVINYEPSLIYSASTSYTLRFSIDDLPPIIRDSLADLPIQIDSMGIKIDFFRTDYIDAWGTLQLPQADFEVLREARIEERNTIFEAKLPFVGWSDITAFVPASVPAGKDTTFTFVYHNHEVKGPVALVTTNENNTEIISVEYYNDATTTSTEFANFNEHLRVVPNPINEQVIISWADLVDVRNLTIVNSLGQIESSVIIDNQTEGILTLDASNWKKGIYFVLVLDEKGVRQAIKRVVKL